ncbi:MAG: hybrid sensor histidine kinase/response regulator [Bdellovibrio sp.]|nr:MAG: hybrid sensor histidine kinase/response regulator [Bdellovibrio sp.]
MTAAEKLDLENAPSVLIVDDIATNVHVLSQALEPEGYNISVANSGEAALKLAPKIRPDIILLDVMMPGLNGFETCRKLKQMEDFKETPVVFITARSDAKDIVEGFESGGSDYITKPFKFEEVCARVNTHFKMVKLLKEREEMIKNLKEAHRKAVEATEELKATQSQLVQNEKMASLGEMVSGIGHEINNPCNFILTHSVTLNKNFRKLKEIIEGIIPNDETGVRVKKVLSPYFEKNMDSIASIKDGAERIAEIVRSLRNFARHGEGDLHDVDLNDVIKSTTKLLNHQTKHIDFKLELSELGEIECSPAQIGQVIMNLVSNAIYAANKNSQNPSVHVRTLDLGDKVAFEVQDNGGGVPDSLLQKIFNPFFTTKPVGEGTGLGLSISFKIVKEHKGEIQVHNNGEGATFRVILPRKQGFNR